MMSSQSNKLFILFAHNEVSILFELAYVKKKKKSGVWSHDFLMMWGFCIRQGSQTVALFCIAVWESAIWKPGHLLFILCILSKL